MAMLGRRDPPSSPPPLSERVLAPTSAPTRSLRLSSGGMAMKFGLRQGDPVILDLGEEERITLSINNEDGVEIKTDLACLGSTNSFQEVGCRIDLWSKSESRKPMTCLVGSSEIEYDLTKGSLKFDLGNASIEISGDKNTITMQASLPYCRVGKYPPADFELFPSREKVPTFD